MVTWQFDGFLGGPTRLMGPGDQPYMSWLGAGAGMFASPGSVDANAVTRVQYAINNPIFNYYGNGPGDGFYAAGVFTLTAADSAAIYPRWAMLSMFIAPASDFATNAVPTPSQIIAARNVRVFRSAPSTASRDPNTTFGGQVFGPRAAELSPNTKYWILLAPTHVAIRSSTPSVANDVPFQPVNTLGRALSAWTNRRHNAPVITAPLEGTLVPAGGLVDLSFQPNSPDQIFTNGPGSGDVKAWEFYDLSGVQVQYSARPTPANPNPPWQDMPIASTAASPTLGRGWFIDYAANTPTNDGARLLRNNLTVKMRCGSNTLTSGAAVLPAGEWRIRMRTFDYGHPYPNTIENTYPGWGAIGTPSPQVASQLPGGGPYQSTNINPDSLPEINTSPWSTPISIVVSTQIPPPIPLSPTNGVAVVNPRPTLSWQYRNTAAPPFAQRSRIVQIREVGQANWTQLVSGNTTAVTYQIPTSYPLTLNRAYEWRVQTTDTSGAVSNFSEAAQFWFVPAPDSGPERDAPPSFIDGATLGCGQHKAFIYRRGGKECVGEVTGLSLVEWERTRDEMSQARVVVRNWGVDCGALLKDLRTWAYELVIFRDNGYSNDRVWEGPITLITYEENEVTLQARDVTAYLYRRIVKQTMNDNNLGDSVVSRATRVVQNALAPDDPNILAYLNPIVASTDAKQYRAMPAYSRTAYEEIDDMASNAGLDYTAVGRSILLWGTKTRVGLLPEFTDKDLGAVPIVSEYGMRLANRYVVSDGNGIWGEATRGLNPVSGNDSFYGLVEMLSSTWANETEGDTGTYTQENIAKITKSFAEFAERSIADRYPAPLIVRVPDNTTLNPDMVLNIQQLVPGVAIPLRSTGTLRPLAMMQKLDSLKVVETDKEETISVSMSPFNRDDGSEEVSD